MGESNPGEPGGISGGKVNIQDVSLTKYIDKATVPILLDCAAGTLITDATLVARRNSATPYIFLTYALQNILVSSASEGGSGGEDRFTENISLAFQKIPGRTGPPRPAHPSPEAGTSPRAGRSSGLVPARALGTLRVTPHQLAPSGRAPPGRRRAPGWAPRLKRPCPQPASSTTAPPPRRGSAATSSHWLALLCDELATAGIPESIQHDDLHMANVYAKDGHLRVLDWGDSSVAHPFFSPIVTFRFLREENGLAPGDPWFDRLRDAYLEPWGSGLEEVFTLAMRVGVFAHAIAWARQRDHLEASEHPDFDADYPTILGMALAGI